MKNRLHIHVTSFVSNHKRVFFVFFTTVLFHWVFSHGKLGLLSLAKANCDRVALPNLQCMLGVLFYFSMIHRTLTRTTGPLTCAQMLMHAIAHGGVRTHVRESSPPPKKKKNNQKKKTPLPPMLALIQSVVLCNAFFPPPISHSGIVFT